MKTKLYLALCMALSLSLNSCGPLLTDSRSPHALEWIKAGKRIYDATGIKLSDLMGPCSGVGCAHEAKESLGRNVFGRASWARAQARISKKVPEKHVQHTVLHELLHTLWVNHTTAKAVMHPYITVGEDCIGEDTIWQLCHLFPGRCQWEHPECTVDPGWKLEVIDANGEKQWVEPDLAKERMRRGKLLFDTLMDLADEASQKVGESKKQ